jgi:hypothetical protein
MFSPEEHHISIELFHITIYASGSAHDLLRMSDAEEQFEMGAEGVG